MKKAKLTTSQVAVMMAILTFVSKLFGFVREMVLANYFGAGMVTDAYVMGHSIPGTLTAAFFAAVGTAYMPILAARFAAGGDKSANKFTSQLINTLTLITTTVFVFALIFSKQLVGLFAPGYDLEKASLTVYYMRISFIALFFSSAMSILDSYLHYKNVFNIQTIIGYIHSLTVIIFIILAAKVDYHLLVFGVVFSYLIRFVCTYFLAKSRGFGYEPDFHLTSTIKEVLELSLPVFIGGSIGEINTFVDKTFASHLPEGSVSALNYSGLVIGTILTFVVSIIVTIIYPKLNRCFANNDLAGVSSLSERGINLISIISIPCAMGAFIYAKDIIHVVYERGAFDSVATAMAATAFMYYAIRIPFNAISQLVVNVFYSMHNTKTPMICSSIALLVNIGFNFILVKPLGIAGLAIATSAAGITNTLLLYFSFKKMYPDIMLLRSKRKLCKVIIFSVIAVAVSYGVYLLCAVAAHTIARLGLSILAAVLTYLGLIYLAKFEEIKLIKDLVVKN